MGHIQTGTNECKGRKTLGVGEACTPSERVSKKKTLRKYNYEKQCLGAGGSRNRDPKRQSPPPQALRLPTQTPRDRH